jgi:hypothetical protein
LNDPTVENKESRVVNPLSKIENDLTVNEDALVFMREIKQNRKTNKGLTQIRLEENEA